MSMRATHHLFGVQPDGQVLHYSTKPQGDRFSGFRSANLNIWKLKKIFTLFALYLEFSNARTPKLTSRQELKLVWSVFDRLDKGKSVPRAELLQTTIMLMQLGVSRLLLKMQTHAAVFAPTLTPQFRVLLEQMNFSVDPRNELIFHSCNPDLYVWTPAEGAQTAPEKMLVVFLTRSNTLNMPRALAHLLLSRLGIPIMYVGNRPNMKSGEFLLGHNLVRTAALIRQIANSLGVNKLYGLGTSYGGFKACQLASELNFERVLNFSGAINDDKVTKASTYNMAPGFDPTRILSILSNSDKIDQNIRQSYDANGFMTLRSEVESPSHGSFTSAYLEDKLTPYLDWLLAGKETF